MSTTTTHKPSYSEQPVQTVDAERGTVVSVRGSVVDVRFLTRLPALTNRLLAGDSGRVVLEVASHESDQVVR